VLSRRSALVQPELNGKLDGYTIRVPTINVSSWYENE
jgi:glyceraldehyde-3-phosphate dehydrogenase/erythrose-4-phosphate dehydrogenase